MPEVRATLVIDVKGNADTKLKGVASASSEVKKGLAGAVQSLTGLSLSSIGVAGAITGVAVALKYSVEQAAEAERVMAQTEAVVKSTGGAAGLTAAAIGDMADRLSKLNAVDDETIQKGANVLLTFKSIKRDAFEPTLQAALDMSTALGTDLQGAIIQVGKALEDPIRGLTALRRSGVSFSEEQRDVIRSLVETGQTAQAQQLILEELNKEFGGSGAAAAQTYSGQMATLKINVDNLAESVGAALLPALTSVTKAMNEGLDFVEASNKAAESGAVDWRLYAEIQEKVRYHVITAAEGAELLNDAVEKQKPATADLTQSAYELAHVYNREVVPSFHDATEAEYQLLTASDGLYDATLKQQQAGAGLAAGLSGELGDAMENYKSIIAETQPEIDKLTAQIGKYQAMQGQTVTVTQDATTSAAEYELAQIKAAAAAQKLAEYTGDSREEFLELQIAAADAQERVITLGDGFGFTKEMTLDYTKKLQDANGTLGELTAKQAEAEAQLKLTTAQFIFQQVAAGLDKVAQFELAEQMGILDKASADTAIWLEKLKEKFDTDRDGAVDASEGQKKYTDEILATQKAIDALHSKDIEITVTTINREINLAAAAASAGQGGGTSYGEQGSGVPGELMGGPGFRNLIVPAPSMSAARGSGAGGNLEGLLVSLPSMIGRAVRDGLQGARM